MPDPEEPNHHILLHELSNYYAILKRQKKRAEAEARFFKRQIEDLEFGMPSRAR